MKDDDLRQRTEATILRLFTNGFGEEADRLVLTQDNPKRDLGGYARKPVEDMLCDALKSERLQVLREVREELKSVDWTDPYTDMVRVLKELEGGA